jgi:hypothetical protein
VFEGGGFGVGVTVTPLDVEPWPVEFLPPGVVARPTRLGEMMPVAARSDAEIAVELQRVQQMEARLAADSAELVAELAARRPDALDRQIGEPGAAAPGAAAPGWLPGPGREGRSPGRPGAATVGCHPAAGHGPRHRPGSRWTP